MPRYSFESLDEPLNPPSAQRQQSPPARSAAQPDNTFDSFDRLHGQRRYSGQNTSRSPPDVVISPVSPPARPHRDQDGRYWGQELGYSNTDSMASNVTRGADNFGEAAGGGIVGVARGVADQHARESGLDAMRNTPGYDPRFEARGYSDYDSSRQNYSREARGYYGQDDDYLRNSDMYGYDPERQAYELQMRQGNSQSSSTSLGAAAAPPTMPHAQNQHYMADPFSDTPYRRYSNGLDPNSQDFDPNAIEDDGDEFGLDQSRHNRGSMMNLTNHSDNSASRIAPAAATGGVMGTLGGMVGRAVSGGNQGPEYGKVPQTKYHVPDVNKPVEKSEWLAKQSSSKRKLKWTIGIVLILLVLGGVGGGVAYYFVNKNTSSPSSGGSGSSAAQDGAQNGDLTKDSQEIQALMNNKNLHKVFPGMDYTPINTQYPDCLSFPPSQNNVTRDIAVLSQLTNVIRLYGTDCNQTEMVLHSISNLGLNGTMKVWLGVWQDKNATTNARQLDQMYKILKTYGTSPFLGVIVGNEILFRQDMTADALTTLLTTVKSNFTTLGYKLPVATSDLGDRWTATLAQAVDYVMANVHPFFTGKDVSQAAAFTWQFWQNNNFVLKPDLTKNYIAETGWPSTGGTDCGSAATSCPGTGSVAGISQMNQFMSEWVCPALTNGTNYFWFEAFDEPWKIIFDQGTTNWEDHWGLMDVNRNLKSGVKIPDCGGRTVPNL